MGFINNTNQGNKFYGNFIGYVKKHLSLGKCKVWVPGVYDNDLISDPDSLPDAIQISPSFGGGNNGNGMFSYPNQGSKVLVSFLNGDQNYPIILGEILGGDKALEQYDDIRNEVPNDSVIHKINCGHGFIKMYESGQIELQTQSKDDPSKVAKITLKDDGNVIIEATQQISLTSPNVKITATKQMDIEAPAFSNHNSNKHVVISPSIDLNAKEGMVSIESAGNPGGQMFT